MFVTSGCRMIAVIKNKLMLIYNVEQ